MAPDISIVIPAYNEEAVVAEVIDEIREVLRNDGFAAEILIVDDGSRDETARRALEAGARVVRHRGNRGYGASLKTGILAAKSDIIAITDADGTYPATYLPKMRDLLEEADMVVGARTGANVNIPLIRRPPKWVLRRLASYVTGRQIDDLNSGLRMFRRELVLPYYPILPSQFSWTTTITMALICDRYAVTYLPINYRARTGKSKIVPWDAAAFFALIVRMAFLFRPLRVFLPTTAVCLLYGVAKAAVDIFVTGDPNISASAVMMTVTGVIVMLVGMMADAITLRMSRFSPNAAEGVKVLSADEVTLADLDEPPARRGRSEYPRPMDATEDAEETS